MVLKLEGETVNNLCYADDINMTDECANDLQIQVMEVKKYSGGERELLKLNIMIKLMTATSLINGKKDIVMMNDFYLSELSINNKGISC